MFKRLTTAASISVASVLLLSACGQADTKEAAPAAQVASQQPADNSDGKNAVAGDAGKLQEEVAKLQEAIGKKDAAEVKRLGKSINDLWLSFENTVRQTFPLEYTEVEKYEMPIFSASAYDKIDFDSLKGNADKLNTALEQLKNAKPSTANTSEILNKAVDNYKAFVDEQADNLAAGTKAFAAAVKAGNVEQAKQEYIKARVYFETIEPIAESFGDLDPKIDARLADVEDEKTWTGYHRIEKALWKDGSLAGQDKYADQLIKDTEELQKKIKELKLEPKMMVAGAIELLNEAATSKITGEEEIYSRTDLVDLAANVNGSKTVYLAIIPALNEKNPDLASQIDKQFLATEELLRGHQKDGQYVTYDKLSTEQIRKISDQLSQLSTLMTQTASIL
ncbi:iron uptake system protein EfeO [Paenibacillus sp. J22TS3]|uniref:iron uptake system protein EfeO n=1 Tax=Paenibacillus sp. J22TS3 TaxID=2807192 RepID=UPI001B23B5BA|nr:iron uptake system protein EfeO [Paenibacillus sp. J22TS3]GIP23625.1 Efem/EfeO family lipoprotein [Paenibacillus sp. J22TS3]